MLPRFSPRTLIARLRPSARGLAVSVVLLAGFCYFAKLLNGFYPVRDWLAVRHVRSSLLAALFAVSCLVGGLRALRLVLPEPPRLGERLSLGFALGVLLFFWGVFVGGSLHLFGPVFFWVWPLALLAWGGRDAWRDVKRLRRHLGPRVGRLLPGTTVEMLAALLIVISLAALYLQVVTPRNLGADAHGYHIPIAEHYAAAGAIRPFADGWYAGAYPHLASVLYTWAFLAPGKLVLHLSLASHLEYVLFIATIGAVASLARRLVGRRMPWTGAAAMFLFPSIFLYDSNLITCADHVLAFWAAPLAIALIRFGRDFTARPALLAGAFTAGALLTKYQGIYLAVPAALAVLLMAARARRVQPLLVCGASVLVFWAPHWLKNLLCYGDPCYPFLHRWFPARPFNAAAVEGMKRTFDVPREFVSDAPLATRLKDAWPVLGTFSFRPHEWVTFHRDWPVFGSLFTLLLPTLPLVRARLRVWLVALGVHLGIVLWFIGNHQDRYLQALVPWMAAVTAVLLAVTWRLGKLARLAAAALVALQLAWGSGFYFFRTHAMAGSWLSSLVEHVTAGFEGRLKSREQVPDSMQVVGDALPPGAKVLIHDLITSRLGYQHETATDGHGCQGLIDYLATDIPAEAGALWHRLGSTHLVWLPGRGAMPMDEIVRELVFVRVVEQYSKPWQTLPIGWSIHSITRQPRDRVLASQPTRIAWLGCRGDPQNGIYSARQLMARVPERGFSDDEIRIGAGALLAGANSVAYRPSCDFGPGVSAALSADFDLVTSATDLQFWARRRVSP